MKRGTVRYAGSGHSLPAPLSREDEREALLRMNEGDMEMRNVLIEHNLRPVIYIARRYKNTGHDVEDLISIGTIGLIKAVNSFNIDHGARLVTYASRCIENEIRMALRRTSRLHREVSLDMPIHNDCDGNKMLLSDVLATDANLVSSDLNDIEHRHMLYAAIQQLPIRDREIVELRFGLRDGSSRTQNEVARILGISQSYISRIENRIYKRLKADLAL